MPDSGKRCPPRRHRSRTRPRCWRGFLFALLLIGGSIGPRPGDIDGPAPGSIGTRPAFERAGLLEDSSAAACLPPAGASARAGGDTGHDRTDSSLLTVTPGEGLSGFEAGGHLKPSLRFNRRVFHFDPKAGAALAEYQRRLGRGNSGVALLGLTGRPGPALRTEFAGRGVDLLDYVPDHGWVARIQGGAAPLSSTNVFCFQPFDAALRLPVGLGDRARRSAEVPIRVHAVRDRPVANIADALRASGFERLTAVVAGDRAHLAGIVAGARLDAFLVLAAAHRDVQWIEAAGRARLLNDDARRTTQSGSFLGPAPFHNRGIHGADQVIAICDTGLDMDSCYFRDPRGLRPPVNGPGGTATDWTLRKVIAANFLDPADDPASPIAWDNHGHGTAVAGCAAGSVLDAPWDLDSDNGIAPGARLVVQDAGYSGEDACADLPGLGCPVTNFYPVLRQAVAQGATIHNNSWGDREQSLDQNTYTQTCRELDLITWSNPQLLVVCAAGNNALDDTVGSPSTAKNGLSVAATMSGSNQERIAGFSSRGWASDGRYKPDLAVPGHTIRTAAGDGDVTTDNCYRTSRSGTSFAAPIASGLAALVRDYFAQGFHPTGAPEAADRRPDIGAALVKAVLINAAVPMSNAPAPPPARDQGWGRVNLSRTLPLTPGQFALLAVDETRGFVETPALPHRTYLRLTSTNRALKVTLVWSDYPATPGADRHLVNDLDLRVRTPDVEFKGNRWIAGRSTPGGDYDRLNNVEQVEWTPQRAGLVEIDVWAHRIVVGPQTFALVVTGDFEPVSAATDADGDGMPDVWEQWHFDNLDPLPEDDPDRDGVPNRDESAARTDPKDPSSHARLELGRLDAGAATFRLRANEAMRYTLEQAIGVAFPLAWSPVSASVLVGAPVGETTLEFHHNLPPDEDLTAPRFYRVRIETGAP